MMKKNRNRILLFKGGETMVGLTFIIFTLIICGSVLFGIYMYLCSENEVKMFSDPEYENRIRKLEKEIKELKENN